MSAAQCPDGLFELPLLQTPQNAIKKTRKRKKKTEVK
jgi:hypothetical protein